LTLKSDRNVRYFAAVSAQTFTFANVPAGQYRFWVHVDGLGYAVFEGTALRDVEIT
jgi:hypothetical protein